MTGFDRIPWLRTGRGSKTEGPAPVASKHAEGGVIVAERRPVCRKCRKPLTPDSYRCLVCGTQAKPMPATTTAEEQVQDDERQAPLVGRYREFSTLTDTQKEILVAALHGDHRRSVRALSSGFTEGIGVQAGTQRFGGREALESVTTMLTLGYFTPTERPFLGLTFRGQLLAEMASYRR